jgi:hypothetical protein
VCAVSSLALPACKSGKVGPLDKAACARRAAELTAWQRKLAADYSMAVQIWPSIKLARYRGKRARTVDHDPFVVRAALEAEHVEMEVSHYWEQLSSRQLSGPTPPAAPAGAADSGKPLDPNKLTLDLFKKQPRAQEPPRDAPRPEYRGPVHVAVDPEATWAVVRAVLRSLGARGARPLKLLFHQRRLPDPPAASFLEPWVREGLRRIRTPIDPSKKATLLSNKPSPVDQLYKSCPALGQMYEQKVAPVHPDRKADAVARHIGAALRACRCSVDLAALRGQLWMLFVPGSEPKTVVPLFVSRGADARCQRLVAKGSALWRDVHLDLIKAARRCGERGVTLAPAAARTTKPR